MKPRFLLPALLSLPLLLSPHLRADAAEIRAPMPIDPLWKSAAFRRAFTASYGIDSRIEPQVTTVEMAALQAVATEMAAGRRDAAIGKLTAHSGLNDSAALSFSLGNLRFEEGQIDDALANFRRAVELHPNFRDAHRNLAVALAQQSQFDEAEPHLIRALELGARDGLTLGLLGYCHGNAGRHQAALQAYRLAQLTMPEEIQWKLGEAHALLDLDDFRASASIYAALLEDRPADGALWIHQADAFLRMGEPERGIANLEFARRLGRLGPVEILALGHLYLNESMVDAAVACYREAISADPPPPPDKAVEAVENLTRFRQWKEAGDLAGLLESVPVLSEGLALAEAAGARSRLNRSRALVELETGDAVKGARMVEELVAADPLDAAALMQLARFHAAAERFEEAEMLLEQAARDPGNEAEALRELGILRVKQGRMEEAVEPLRRALAIEPSPELEAYLELVERAAR